MSRPDRFRIYAPMLAWKAQGDRNELRIGGIVSTDCLDRQSERVLQDGLDFSDFLSYGWFNDNHKQGTTDVLGYPTTVMRVKPGQKLPNGDTAMSNGWWADGYLLDTQKGREVHEMAAALAGTPRGLGFSIEGKTGRRKGSVIQTASIRNVAITPVPVNPETNLVALAKALMAGSDVANPGAAPGQGFPMRVEDLNRPDSEEVEDDDLDEDDDEDDNLLTRKALSARVPAQTTTQLVEEWADALAEGVRTMGEPEEATLTKSEAEIVRRYLYPRVGAVQRSRATT